MKKYKVGIIGATGMVGQRFTLLLENHISTASAVTHTVTGTTITA